MTRNKKILIGVAIALAAYVAYRFFKNGGSIGGGAGVDTTGTGSNAGSLAPFVGGSSGPNSGLNYYAGNTQVNIPLPGEGSEPEPKPVHGPIKFKPRPPVHPPVHLPPGRRPPRFKPPPRPISPRPRPRPRPRPGPV